MRKVAVLSIAVILPLLMWGAACSQPSSPTASPLSPLSAPALSPIPSPTPEPLELPGAPGEWWKVGGQLISHFGPCAAIGLLLLLGFLYFLWRIGEQVTGEEAKGIAARLRKGARVFWHRATRRPTAEEQAVVRNVRTVCEWLDLKGFVKEQLIIVSLESVYVPLTTRHTAGVGGLSEGMPLLRAAEGAGEVPLTDLVPKHRCLVLVGEAGSGKTTFLKHVALTACDACVSPRGRGDSWLPDPPPLPLFLSLHDLGRHLTKQEPADTVSPRHALLLEYITACLSGLDLPDGWIAERLEAGTVLLLLDGLDEVAHFEDRRFIAELVTRFASFYDRCRVVVTTRPQGYTDAAQLGGSFERRDISPLAWPDDIRAFLYRWNEEINRRVEGGSLSHQGRRRAHENAESLMARLENAPNVRGLANNPLLLTVMAIVHYNVGDLPERRADLYNAATELLLGWDKRMGRRALVPPPWLDTLSAAQRRLPLEELAFDFQERRSLEGSRAEALSFLGGHFLAGEGAEAEEEAHRRAEEYLAWVADRTYVLQDIGGVIRFYRKPFQEYLAARRLARKPDLQSLAHQILAKDWRDRWWDETLLLTVGHLVTDNPQKANDLLVSIQDLPDPPGAPHYNISFTARALADVPEGLLGSVWKVRDRAVEHLAKALAAVEPAFAPQARLEAGVALGALGDPRPGVGVVEAADRSSLPDVVWVEVPAGLFLMGSIDEEVERWKEWVRQKVQEEAYKVEGLTQEQVLEILAAWLEGERGQHVLESPAFLISRYPITNAQYRCFVKAGGYEDPAWWDGEESPAWAWRTGEPRLGWQRTDGPDFWHDPRFNGLNQPVVGVTWYEAMAFCRWLSEQLRVSGGELQVWRDGQLQTSERRAEAFTVRLPSETEWEKAARGADGRTWPWGNEWDETLTNTWETGLKQPSPVGILPGGESPYGVADAVGNVWEWTLSLWGETGADPPSATRIGRTMVGKIPL